MVYRSKEESVKTSLLNTETLRGLPNDFRNGRGAVGSSTGTLAPGSTH